jgi:UDP-glucose-4-epimerase GalE
MRAHAVAKIVFSSSCTTYGARTSEPITEDRPQAPVDPYGRSKWMVEQILRDYAHAYGLRAVALRYFNAAGADPDGETGELHHPETHLIPLAIAAAQGDVPELQVFGTDYDTPDGTAIRDYIHVVDLAAAHVRALERLAQGAPSGAFNLGTGRGHSVREVVAAVEQCGKRKVPLKLAPRREGDAPVLVADPSRAFRDFDWTPRHSSLEEIVASAWEWYCHSRSAAAGQPA